MSSERTRRLALLGGAAVLALVAVVVAIVISQGGGDDDNAEPAAGGGSPASDTAEVTDSFEGIPQRSVTLGDPDAPATLIEFADLQCPFCAQYATDALPAVVDQFVRTGRPSCSCAC